MHEGVLHVADVGAPWIEVAPDADAIAAFVRRARAATGPDLALAAAARVHVADRSFLDLDTVAATAVGYAP